MGTPTPQALEASGTVPPDGDGTQVPAKPVWTWADYEAWWATLSPLEKDAYCEAPSAEPMPDSDELEWRCEQQMPESKRCVCGFHKRDGMTVDLAERVEEAVTEAKAVPGEHPWRRWVDRGDGQKRKPRCPCGAVAEVERAGLHLCERCARVIDEEVAA